VCGWEDDLSQLRFATTRGGANTLSLVAAQSAFTAVPLPAAAEGYRRDPNWRPLDITSDEVEVPLEGKDYGSTYDGDATKYYYWRTADR
jgi:Cysteine-rich CPCC